MLGDPHRLSDYQWSDKMRSDLAVAFNGKSEDTHYWESVSSFYEKSSFAQLHLSFTVADPYHVSSKAVDFLQKSKTSTLPRVRSAVRHGFAIAAYKSKTGDFCKDFDVNGEWFHRCGLSHLCLPGLLPAPKIIAVFRFSGAGRLLGLYGPRLQRPCECRFTRWAFLHLGLL
jgi:hypothetical protein